MAILLLRHGAIARATIGVTGLVLGVATAGVTADILDRVAWVVLALTVAAIPFIFLYQLDDQTLRSWVAMALLRRKRVSLGACARSRDPDLLIRLLNERYPDWVAPGLPEAVREQATPGTHAMAPNQLETSLSGYLKNHPPTAVEELLETLERWTAPWTHGAALIQAVDRDRVLPTVRDFVTTERHPLEAPLPHLERIPLLYRLHRLQQLSTVSVTTHFGATHTRFSHTVGTVLAANQMLRQLREQPADAASPLVSSALKALDDPIVRSACLAYCALHDAFHGPFGHSLDIMKDVFFPRVRTQKLDDRYFSEGLASALAASSTDPVGQQIRAAAEMWVGPEHAEKLLRTVQILTDPELHIKDPKLYFLRQIADSEIDADRIDYVARDGLYLEQKDNSRVYCEAIATLRLVEWTPSKPPPDDTGRTGAGSGGDPPRPRVCLAFASSVEDQLAELLGRRREYYTLHYEAPDKLVVDDMICHGLAYVLRRKEIPDDTSDDTVARLKRNIMLLTDDTFIPALLDLKASPEDYDLLFRYQQRRFFVRVKTIGISLDEVVRIRHVAKRWIDAVDAYLDDQAEQHKVRFAAEVIPREELRQAFTSYFESSLKEATQELPSGKQRSRSQDDADDGERMDEIVDLDLKILSFGFQYWTQAAFRQRQKFEEEVWKQLRLHSESTDKLMVLAESEYGDASEWRRYDDFPPIHVTTPSHFGLLDKRDVLLQRKESHYPAEDILFYDPSRPDEPHTIAVKPAAKGDRPSYPLVLSAPEEVVEAFGEHALVAAFVSRLKGLTWLLTAHGVDAGSQ